MYGLAQCSIHYNFRLLLPEIYSNFEGFRECSCQFTRVDFLLTWGPVSRILVSRCSCAALPGTRHRHMAPSAAAVRAARFTVKAKNTILQYIEKNDIDSYTSLSIFCDALYDFLDN